MYKKSALYLIIIAALVSVFASVQYQIQCSPWKDGCGDGIPFAYIITIPIFSLLPMLVAGLASCFTKNKLLYPIIASVFAIVLACTYFGDHIPLIESLALIAMPVLISTVLAWILDKHPKKSNKK